MYLDVKGNRLKKSGCNLWGLTGLVRTSLPLAPPCPRSADLEAPRRAPRLQRSAQLPTRKLRLGIRACAGFLRKRKAEREGDRSAIEFFFPIVNVCRALRRSTRPRHVHLQSPGGSPQVISQYPALRPK